MKPPKTTFVCQDCGSQAAKWLGKCPDCGAWNSFVEERAQEAGAATASAHRYALAGSAATARLYADIAIERMERASTGIGELDRVLGGGVVPGSLVLLGGEPGIGKSTLLVEISRSLQAQGRRVLYVSGEESPQQIKLRADRLHDPAAAPRADAARGALFLMSEANLERV